MTRWMSPLLMWCVAGCLGGGGGGAAPTGDDCRLASNACALGFMCVADTSGAWSCKDPASGGNGGNGQGPWSSAQQAGAPPEAPDLDAIADELGADVTEGEYETSQGTVTVELAPCDRCPEDPMRVYYSCGSTSLGWLGCINRGGGQCLWAAVANTPFGNCGGYFEDFDDLSSQVARECREVGDYEVECYFPGVVTDQLTVCDDAECFCDTPGGCASTAIEYCIVMDNITTPNGNAYWASYYRAGEFETSHVEAQNFVPATPNCNELGLGGGGGGNGGLVGRDEAIQKQCTEIVACAGGPIDQCLMDIGEFYDSSDTAMQSRLRELVATCMHLRGCEYLDCSAL